MIHSRGVVIHSRDAGGYGRPYGDFFGEIPFGDGDGHGHLSQYHFSPSTVMGGGNYRTFPIALLVPHGGPWDPLGPPHGTPPPWYPPPPPWYPMVGPWGLKTIYMVNRTSYKHVYND